MNDRGHNENAVRLAALAGAAQVALDKVARGEAEAFDGWLAYGAALNEGRSLFASDEQFGQWVAEVVTGNLPFTPESHERAAAMWAAANADQFAEARAAGNARTIRGIHAKWKEVEAEREKARREEERRQKAEADRREAAEKAGPAAKADPAPPVVDHEPPAPDTQAALPVTGETQAEAAAEPEDRITAKIRREFRKLTKQAQEDEFVGIRRAFHEERVLRRKAQAEAREAKAQLKEMAESKDLGPKVSSLIMQLANMKDARDEKQTLLAKETRRANFFEAEVKRLKAESENRVEVL
jgi:hypothetical protein